MPHADPSILSALLPGDPVEEATTGRRRTRRVSRCTRMFAMLVIGMPGQHAVSQTPTARLRQTAIPYALGLPNVRTSHSGVRDSGFAGWQTFESFTFARAERITEFRWQGVYWDDDVVENNPAPPNTNEWELTIWSDAGGEPGTMVFSETRPAAEVASAQAGSFEYVGYTIDRQEFAFPLSTPFQTEPGATYWISAMSSADDFWPFFLTSVGAAPGLTPPRSQEAVAAAFASADGCFQRDIVRGESYRPTGDRAITLITLPVHDVDEDGMDDAWEEEHGLDPALDDSGEDPDSDGLDNLREFERGTDPANADTDGDGLADLVETGTGIFLDESDRGTSPLLADTDGDGLDDGLEVPGTEGGTDPILPDSDEDGIHDGEEAALGTDPTRIDSDGDGIADSWELARTTDPLDPEDPVVVTLRPRGASRQRWTAVGTLPTFDKYGGSLDLADVTFRVAVDFDAKPAGTREVIFETGAGTIGFSLVYEAGNRLVLRAVGNDGTSLAVVAHVLSDAKVAGGEIEVVWGYDVANAEGTQTIGLWIDGTPAGETARDLGGDWSGGNAAAFGVDRSVMAGTGFNQSLRGADFSSGTINLADGLEIFTNTYPVIDTLERLDTDGDGMPDYYEKRHGLDPEVDDTAGDLDGDGLANADEFRDGTLPNAADSDGDGLDDGAETGTGTFVDAEDTGTDPLDPDTDGDGLRDGAETGTGTFVDAGDAGTDPNEPDTDDDGSPDGLEVAGGWDPLDPLDEPAATAIADSTIDFSTEQGSLGWEYGYRNYSLDGGGENYDPEAGFIPFLETELRGSGWGLAPSNAPWTLIGPNGMGHPNGTNSAPNEEHWSIRRWVADSLDCTTPLQVVWFLRAQNLGGGNGTGGSLHLNGVQVDKAVIGGTDAVGVERRVFLNVEPGDVIDLALTPENTDGSRSDGSDGSYFGLSIHARLPADPMNPVGPGFSEYQPFSPASGACLFQISEVRYDATLGTITLTWPSNSRGVYTISYSPDLVSWLEIDDNHPSGGERTSYEIFLDDLGEPRPTLMYFRVGRP